MDKQNLMRSFKQFLTTLPAKEASKPTKYEAAFKAGWEAAHGINRPTTRVEKVIAEIELAAINWEESHDKSWGQCSDKPDSKMVIIGKRDALDLRYIATLIKEGMFKEACNSAASLDTVVRDQLPESFFKFIEQNGIPW